MENTQACSKVAPDVNLILQRLNEIETFLSLQKSIYAEQNQLVKQFMDTVGVNTEITFNGSIYKIVDQFAAKDVVFKVAAVRRFELVSETVADRTAKIAKALKK